MPVTLHAADARLMPSTSMTGGLLSLDAQAASTPGGGGTVTGKLTVETAGGTVVLDANWPLDVA